VNGFERVGSTNPLLDADLSVPFGTNRFVVFPDAAPIGPRHCLVVPHDHVLSFGRLGGDAQRRTLTLVEHLFESFTPPDGHEPVVFEHGSCEETEAESVGCSITHAHLHVLFFPVGTVAGFTHRDEFEQYENLLAAWNAVESDDYYLYGRFGGEVRATPVREDPALACSMFLRKRFASEIDRSELADYRRYQTRGSDDMLDEVEHTHQRLTELRPPN
jgi:hypothetical protein